MNLKHYRNEIIVFSSICLMFFAYIYKHNNIISQVNVSQESEQSFHELKELIALKKTWANKKITKKIKTLKALVAPSKVKWKQEGKKLKVFYKNLTPNELNKLITKVLNLSLIIQKLDIKKTGTTYTMELKCKW